VCDPPPLLTVHKVKTHPGQRSLGMGDLLAIQNTAQSSDDKVTTIQVILVILIF